MDRGAVATIIGKTALENLMKVLGEDKMPIADPIKAKTRFGNSGNTEISLFPILIHFSVLETKKQIVSFHLKA